MNTIIIILAVIGLLKVVSLFILFGIETYYRIIKVDIDGIKKSFGIYKDSQWYLIPTISISKSNQYLEFMIYWLCFQYYSSYSIDKGENET